MLTPLVKAYCAQRGFDVCLRPSRFTAAMVISPITRLSSSLRDCKITSIYEGTDGIQAMDLLGRKLGMAEGQVFINFLGEIQKTMAQGQGDGGIGRDQHATLEKAVNRLGEMAMNLGKTAMSERFNVAFAACIPVSGSHGRCHHGLDAVVACRVCHRETRCTGPRKKTSIFTRGNLKRLNFSSRPFCPPLWARWTASSKEQFGHRDFRRWIWRMKLLWPIEM